MRTKVFYSALAVLVACFCSCGGNGIDVGGNSSASMNAKLVPVSATVAVGAQVTYTVQLDFPSNPGNFFWSSSDPKIATVDHSGIATGVAPGTVTIKMVTPEGIPASAALTVVPAPSAAQPE